MFPSTVIRHNLVSFASLLLRLVSTSHMQLRAGMKSYQFKMLEHLVEVSYEILTEVSYEILMEVSYEILIEIHLKILRRFNMKFMQTILMKFSWRYHEKSMQTCMEKS